MSTMTALAISLVMTSSNPLNSLTPNQEFFHIHGAHCATVDESHSAFGLKTLQERMHSDPNAVSTLTSPPPADELTVLRVAVWYRPGWANAIGEQEIDRRVEKWFEQTNQAFRNSKVNVKIVPAFVREMAYEFEENGEIIGTFGDERLDDAIGWDWMSVSPYGGGTDEFLPDDYPMFHLQTHAYGADHWLWIQEGQDADVASGPLGIAAFNSAGMRVVDQATAPTNSEIIEGAILNTGYTIAHELGHNLGLMHEFEEAGESEFVEPDSYASTCGFGSVPGTGTTIMWSVSNPNSLNKPVFSNPDVFWHDSACGNYEQENQARVLNLNAPISATRGSTPAIIGSVRFGQANYIAGPDWETLTVDIIRDGDLSVPAELEVTAFDGSATQGVDFDGVKQVITFSEGQATAVVEFELLNPGAEQTRTFDLKMQYPLNLEIETPLAVATLQGNDTPGWAGDFAITPSLTLSERGETELVISRTGTTTGEALLKLESMDGSAKSGVHFQEVNQFVRFSDGETQKAIPLYGYPVASALDFTVSLSSEANVNLLSNETYVSMVPGLKGEATFSENGEVLDYTGQVGSCAQNGDSFCSLRINLDEATNIINVEISRLYGEAGDLDITVSVVPDEGAVEGTRYNVAKNDVVSPIQTLTLENGEVVGNLSFEIKDLPEGYNRGGLQLVIDDGSDKSYWPHPTYTFVTFPILYANDDDCEGNDCDDGNGDNDGDGDGGDEGNPPPTNQNPPPSSDNTKGSSTGFTFFIMFIVSWLAIGRSRRKGSGEQF